MLRSILVPLVVAGAWLASPRAAARPPQDPPAPAQDKPAPAPDKGAFVPVPLPQGTRVFLKDGNFLLVREYKIQGDRVRYWSVERSSWEEIPKEIVDWEATHKGEAEDAAQKKQIDEKLQEIRQHERANSLDVDASVEVAPNVYLPDEAGFYVVANGTVATLSQDLADSTMSKRRLLVQILSPIPIVPTKHNVDLKEAHAKLRLHDSRPEFYFRTADKREPAVALLRVQIRGNSRHIVEINTVAISGQSYTKENQILLERWVVALGTYRYTVAQKLEAGEYAFIENLPDKGMELYVWDFGVDASTAAPEKK
ncbi:MAG TPA: hypothetical protein VKG84_08310 [Candidatus Acidoferrales bacterium]|nr:hypothetical protein [Candidatus Acidoferrales bacterium]